MRLHSLAWSTDLMFARFDGCVTDRGDHLVVATPSDPGFHWGNFLLYRRPPAVGDLPRWEQAFRAAFARIPAVRHMAFGWDDPAGHAGKAGPFLRDGYLLERSVVLAASRVRRPMRSVPGLAVRPLSSDRDWAQALAGQILWLGAGFDPRSFKVFKRAQMARYRRMADAGQGRWFGGFWKGRLVADLGIFAEAGVGRFQNVEVAPEFRGRGLGRTLVYEAARFALERMGVRRLVVVSERGRLYASAGFQTVERQACLCRTGAVPLAPLPLRPASTAPLSAPGASGSAAGGQVPPSPAGA